MPTPPPPPTSTPTQTPTPTSTPPPTPKINLRPISPGAGELPLSVHAELGTSEPGDLRTGATVYIDWFFENNSPFPTENEFVSHVYVDNVFVNNWVSSQAPPFQTFGVRDWSELNDRVRLDRGDHVFKLIIDALDQIPESDETDNVFERTFTWGGESLSSQALLSRNVNLVIEPVPERSESVVTAAVAGAGVSGPLTVDSTTFVSFGVGNTGLASTDATIGIHIYFDGLLVENRIIDGLAALSKATLTDWDELADKIEITPGQHSLEVIVDPGGLIQESDETDNTATVLLTWGSGPAVPPDPLPEITPVPAPPYEELTLPNLATYLPSDWDTPLVIRGATSGGSVSGRNGHVGAFTAGVVDYAITNNSGIANLNPFSSRLLLDGVVIDDSGFARGGPGGVWMVDVTIPADRLTAGTHTLKLEIDSAGEVTESDETDNSITTIFDVVAGPAPDLAAPLVYSDAELTAMLDIVPELFLETANADASDGSGIDWLAAVNTVADAAYYLATGTALSDERIAISLLSRAEYDARSLAICLEDQDTLTTAEYDSTLSECRTTIEGSAGLTWSGSGIARVEIDASTTPARVLATLLHELGHARQGILVPATSSTVLSDASSAIGEAQAQVFEAVGIRHIEEFLGVKFTQYPDLVVIQDDVNDLIDFHVKRAVELEEHSLGYQVMWLAALQDVGGLGLADELRTTGALSAGSALSFYNYLLTIDGQDPVTWVNARLAGGASLIEEFRAIALSRLAVDLPPGSEGHPHLIDLAFFAP
ncbi:MAG TPA: CARDB domain-containing protein [Dehalococcoidia bacterium]|nr:hypothetical protein [Chloroflexota bacterium]MDP5877406.1 CARDB domain-containing protein [Dehalococcoidia bacterium]MDP6272457.1 CARDB domain-containing protein [Dehalococcoidia bacterium]MDP7160067.1 CARDB domain-containing protein [Dehalococcoidia bacterium]MDP7212315.1 CARDB domain-containing protein [Dehalococcoidia bacterium]